MWNVLPQCTVSFFSAQHTQNQTQILLGEMANHTNSCEPVGPVVGSTSPSDQCQSAGRPVRLLGPILGRVEPRRRQTERDKTNNLTNNQNTVFDGLLQTRGYHLVERGK